MAHRLEVTQASVFLQQGPAWSHCRWRLLAEGDSWFSLGALNPFKSANLLQSMSFSSMSAAVQCALPGDTLHRMVDLRRDPNFVKLLTGNVSWRWDAILLSAGGNDLIDAAQSAPQHPLDKRLLRTAAEWGPPSQGVARYLSDPGWQTFAAYLQANLELIVRLRDSKSGPDGSLGRPICMHTYAHPTPRPSGAGLGFGPWLMPAMQAYAIPPSEWQGVARALLDRLADLLLACAADAARFPALFVFDTRGVPIVPAQPGSTGSSGDWANEIHLTHGGCDKLADAWCAQIEQVMVAHP